MAKEKKALDVRDELPKYRNPVKVMRAKCLDCCGGSAKEVELCPIEKCPLWRWRFGKNPFREKRELTDEQKAAAKERMAKLNASRAKTAFKLQDE
jgi:hypothetical protein